MKPIFLLLVVFALASFPNAGPAKADAIYNLTYDSCSGGCGNGSGTNNNNFGYVDLHQVNSTQVSVTVQLTSPAYFVNTGNGTNHAPFAFNVDQSVTISGLTDSNSSPSTYFTAGATNASISGLGTFSNEIGCTNNCPHGASNGGEGTLMTFTLTGSSALSFSDFIANSGGYFFSADIIGPAGNTGEVAANNAPTITGGGSGAPAPEPASLMVFGSALAAFAYVRRGRHRSRGEAESQSISEECKQRVRNLVHGSRRSQP